MKSASNSPIKRDQKWLEECYQNLLTNHFPDLPKGYPIRVCFGSPAKNRFGSISARNGVSIIRLNGLFTDPELPLYVVQETLAHELAHYVHGFGSGLPKRYEHPHMGGVVEQELFQRGLEETHHLAEAWRKAHWRNFYESHCTYQIQQSTERKTEQSSQWELFWEQPSCRSTEELLALWETLKKRLKITQIPKIEQIEWLPATLRQVSPSYYYPAQKRLALHGLLADRRVPQKILEFEIAYWLLRLTVSSNIKTIQAGLEQHKMGGLLAEAMQWRGSTWTRFRNRHHPLQ